MDNILSSEHPFIFLVKAPGYPLLALLSLIIPSAFDLDLSVTLNVILDLAKMNIYNMFLLTLYSFFLVIDLDEHSAHAVT